MCRYLLIPSLSEKTHVGLYCTRYGLFHAYRSITGSNMIRSIRTVMLLVGIDRTSSSNQFHCISSTYHTLTVTYTLDWAYKLTDEPELYFVSEM